MGKADKIEWEKRIRVVMEWIIEDWPYADIVTNIIAKWNLEERQAKRYVKAARDKWNEQENELVERKRRLKIESLKKLKRSLQEKYKGTPHGIRAVLHVEKELIKLEGLNPAMKLEVTGKDGKPIKTENTNVSVALSSEEIKRFAKELEEEV